MISLACDLSGVNSSSVATVIATQPSPNIKPSQPVATEPDIPQPDMPQPVTPQPIAPQPNIPEPVAHPTAAPKQLPTMKAPASTTQISRVDGMKLLYVPAGKFQMGSSDYGPIHTVDLDAFWIDQTDVTNAMFAKYVASNGGNEPPLKTSSNTRKSYFQNSQYANYPVIYVSWDQADAYCKWAGRQLPTEAQWEKAARGTDGRTYPWGEGIDKSKANYDPAGQKWDNDDTSKVGSYPAGASPYGALDMAGNVWQWVADWYESSYYAGSPDQNPTGPDSGTARVARGGSAGNDSSLINSAARLDVDPLEQDFSTGFRCAMSAAPQTGTPANFQVYFRNDCNKTADFAIYYMDLNSNWVIDGWWEIKPGESAYVADTKNTIFAYYGELVEGNYFWAGTDQNLAIKGSTKSYGFKDSTINMKKWGKWTQIFTCSNGS